MRWQKTSRIEQWVRETTGRYDEIAENYNSDWRGKLDHAQLAQPKKFEAMVGSPPRKILDAGCGTGRHCRFFAGLGYDVYGVDRSAGMLRKAVENSMELELEINFAIGDIWSLSFTDNAFDGVWTVATISHLTPENKQKFLQEAHRVLKPGGILHIGVHNFLSITRLKRLSRFYLSYFVQSDDHLAAKIGKIKEIVKWAIAGYVYLDERHWFYPRKSFLINMLRETGFVVLESNSRFSKRLSIYARKT